MNTSVSINEKAVRCINTLADVRKLTDAHRIRLFLAIGADPQAAYDYCIEQSGRDWQDRQFARGLIQIARAITREYPLVK